MAGEEDAVAGKATAVPAVLPGAGAGALVRRPSPRLAQGIVTHLERQPVDYGLACRQWEAYVDALSGAGWELIEVPPADEHPDSVFVEDTVLVYGTLAVMARPGAEARRGEEEAVAEVLESLGYELAPIRAPGTLDGGDVLKIGTTVYVGRGGRTNAEGVRQLRAVLVSRGARVVAVPINKVLHLKSAVTALPDGTVLGYPPLVDTPTLFERFLPVPEESGAHVVDLGQERVLMAADCPRSVALVADLGYEPVTVEIGEFEKLEGCVTCLSVRLRDRPEPPGAGG